MITLYAFVRGLGELSDDELETVELGAVTAVVGPASGDDREDVVRHGLRVEALVDAADAVLPARFGERFADVAALADALDGRLEELDRRLAAVDGCVELSVRVARTHEQGRRGTAAVGAYLRSRLRAAAADSATAQELHARLADGARAAVVAEPGLSGLVHDASYLIERGEVDAFAASVAGYAAAHPELRLVCTGPWAPASFAGAA